MNEKNKKLLNNTFLFLLGNIGSKFIQFILVPLYTYTLSTAEYGITEIVLTAINFLFPVFSMSIADGFLRFGLSKDYDKDKITSICIKITMVGSVISIICTPLLSINSTLSTYMIFFLTILNLRMYRDLLSIRLKVLDKNKMYAIDSILYTFSLCISNVIMLIVLKQGINGYFISYIVANIISIIFLMCNSEYKLKSLTEKSDKETTKKLIKYSLPMIINAIAWWITTAADKFMLQYMMNDSAVGIYSIATKLPTFVTTFTGVFNQAWIISSVIEFDNDREKKFYSNTFKKYVGLLFLGTTFMICIIKPFIKVYVSQEYFEAWTYAPVLLISATASGIAAFMVGIYAAFMKNINITVTTVIGGVLNIILNYILIDKIGIMGAAVATYVSWLIIAIARIIDSKKFFDFKIDIKKLIIYNILTIIQAICIVVLNNWIGEIIAVAIFMIIAIKEREIFTEIIKIIKSKLLKKEKRKNEQIKEKV